MYFRLNLLYNNSKDNRFFLFNVSEVFVYYIPEKPEPKITIKIDEEALKKQALMRLSKIKGKRFEDVSQLDEANKLDFQISLNECRQVAIEKAYGKIENLRQYYACSPDVLMSPSKSSSSEITIETGNFNQTQDVNDKETLSKLPAADDFTQLKTGSAGSLVLRLQKIINKWDPYFKNEIKENGIFDESAVKAIAYFNKIYNLGNTAEITAKTNIALLQIEDGSFWKENTPYKNKTKEQTILYEKARKYGLTYNAKQKRSLASRYKVQKTQYRPLNQEDGLSFIINEAAQKYNLDPNLIKAVISAESSFNKNAVSPCGAEGLMQLMPGTAASLGVKDSFNSRENVMAGAKYLRQHLDEFGTVEKALAAYNAGPGAVRQAGGIPPYRETKKYIGDVLTYYEKYRATSQNNNEGV